MCLEKNANPVLAELINTFDTFLKEHIILGFNSGKYDLNVVKPLIIKHLRPRISFTILKNNDFMCLKTDIFKFLDIKNYIAPGFSYKKFIKAYGASQYKFYSPYEWFDSLEKFKHDKLPPYEAFYSSLKKKHFSAEKYQLCQRVWEECGWKSMRDILVYYNNLDVEPFLTAVETATSFYKGRHIDMMKDGISLPGLTLRYMFSNVPKGDYFTIINRTDADLHWLLKGHIVGGPSIIFHHYHENDVTLIRQNTNNQDSLPCKKILGYDANACCIYQQSCRSCLPNSTSGTKRKIIINLIHAKNTAFSLWSGLVG